MWQHLLLIIGLFDAGRLRLSHRVAAAERLAR
jgi:hypothetical protein